MDLNSLGLLSRHFGQHAFLALTPPLHCHLRDQGQYASPFVIEGSIMLEVDLRWFVAGATLGSSSVLRRGHALKLLASHQNVAAAVCNSSRVVLASCWSCSSRRPAAAHKYGTTCAPARGAAVCAQPRAPPTSVSVGAATVRLRGNVPPRAAASCGAP